MPTRFKKTRFVKKVASVSKVSNSNDTEQQHNTSTSSESNSSSTLNTAANQKLHQQQNSTPKKPHQLSASQFSSSYGGGVFPSSKPTPPLISTGSIHLDQIITTPHHSSTQLPFGELLLLRRDENTNYGRHLGRYFVSEGVVRQQSAVVCIQANGSVVRRHRSSGSSTNSLQKKVLATANDQTMELLEAFLAFDYTFEKQKHEKKKEEQKKENSAQSQSQDAPSQNDSKESSKTTNPAAADESDQHTDSDSDSESHPTSQKDLNNLIEKKQSELKVAWQYRDMVERQMKRSVRFHGDTKSGDASDGSTAVECHEFDLSKSMQKELIEPMRDDLMAFNLSDGVDVDDLYKNLREKLLESEERMQQLDKDATKNPVLRIFLEDFGSNLYLTKYDEDDSPQRRNRYLIQFVHKLKYLLRKSCAVCFITLPPRLPQSLEESFDSLADLLMDMYSFTGSNVDVSQSYELIDYTGMINIRKLPHFNTLTAHFFPDVLSYVYKLKRRKLYIEKLHLPPEETRAASDPNRIKFTGANKEPSKPKSILKKRIPQSDESKKPSISFNTQDSQESQPASKSQKSKKRSVGFSAPIGGVDKKDLEF